MFSIRFVLKSATRKLSAESNWFGKENWLGKRQRLRDSTSSSPPAGRPSARYSKRTSYPQIPPTRRKTSLICTHVLRMPLWTERSAESDRQTVSTGHTSKPQLHLHSYAP